MSNWYFAGVDRQRHGPISGADLAQHFRDGTIGLDALVWRDGMAQWQPLGEMTAELGLLDDAPAATAVAAPTYTPPAPVVPSGWAGENVTPAAASAAATSPYAAPMAPLSGNAQVVLGGEVVYAGFWKRVAAYTIDAFIIGFATQLIQLVLFGVFMGFSYSSMFSRPENLFSSASGIAVVVAAYLIPLAINVAYYAGMHASSRQATLGKMAVGIKVVGDDGQRISLARGIGRLFATILSSLILFIGYLMAGFTERKQALHDMVCSTLVVDRWAYTDHPELQRRDLGGVTIAILVIFGVLMLLALAFFAIMVGVIASGGFGH